jgi:hypothetical protein
MGDIDAVKERRMKKKDIQGKWMYIKLERSKEAYQEAKWWGEMVSKKE